MGSPRLRFATCADERLARTVLFGANTQGAGFSESARGKSGEPRSLFSADFVRDADNESPSLTESLADGASVFDAGNLPLHGLPVEEQVARARTSPGGVPARAQIRGLLGGERGLRGQSR